MYQPRQLGNIRKQAYHATLNNLSQGSSFYTAFNATQERVHQRDLPLAPTSEKGLNTHQYRQEFIEAKNLEFNDLARRDTFILTPRKKANLAKLVPIKWVYTYKTDENGFFVKCKAQLVVQGDLQHLSDFNKVYAATLAAWIFRLTMALMAYFDIEVRQFNVVSAFTNADMDETVYIPILEGIIQTIEGSYKP